MRKVSGNLSSRNILSENAAQTYRPGKFNIAAIIPEMIPHFAYL
jgi:hypothetical protein